MKISVFSMAPVFKDHVHGGSQKILKELLKHLGKKHDVHVLCTRREDNKDDFTLFPNVIVSPKLPFKETYPEPYYTAPYNLANAVQLINEDIDKNDVVYIHDSEMNFFFLYEKEKPFVTSLRDFVYPDTLIGAFNFRRDQIIVNSQLTKENIRYTIGRYMPQINDRVSIIPNGIDLDFFKRTKPKEVTDFISSDILTDNVILYPHRPDSRKGIFDILQVVSKLKHKHGIRDIRLFVPVYIDMNTSDGKKSYYGDSHYNSIKRIAEEQDITDAVVFHPWIPFELMPQYYSLGKLTFSTGTFVEAFGCNSSLESICCDTPVILSRVGAQRTTLPEGIIDKVDPYDTEAIEKLTLEIFKNGRDLSKAKKFISETYDFETMLKNYEQVLENASPLPIITPEFKQLSLEKLTFKLPPWCYLGKKGLYNDYKYGYVELDSSIKNLLNLKPSFSFNEAKNFGIQKEQLREEIISGNLVYHE